MVRGTFGNLDITDWNESNLVNLDMKARQNFLLNVSRHYLDRIVYEDQESSQLYSLSAKFWSEGDLCIARLTKDKVWFNAEVLEVDGTAI